MADRAVYVTLGWVAVIAFPQLVVRARAVAWVLVAAGGILYTAGAVVYALRRPDPVPAVFGYHEIFHVLVIAAAVLQFVAVAAYALPGGLIGQGARQPPPAPLAVAVEQLRVCPRRTASAARRRSRSRPCSGSSTGRARQP